MSSTDRAGAGSDGHAPAPPGAPLPLGQRLYDNMFLLLVAGIVIMLVVYTGWGMWELHVMPRGTLP